MNTKDLQIDTFKSVGVTRIIPEEWGDFIWTALSDNAPFSWGDNNHTLVDAFSFGDHLQSELDYLQDDYEDVIKQYREAVFDTINYLHINKIYIDLEQ
jgi:hypothetical protein